MFTIFGCTKEIGIKSNFNRIIEKGKSGLNVNNFVVCDIIFLSKDLYVEENNSMGALK